SGDRFAQSLPRSSAGSRARSTGRAGRKPGPFGLEAFAVITNDAGARNICEKRNSQSRQSSQSCRNVERTGNNTARLGEELEAPSGFFGDGSTRLLFRLLSDLLSQPVEINEDLDLGAQHLGHDRGRQEIDTAGRVATCLADFVGKRGQKDDRNM